MSAATHWCVCLCEQVFGKNLGVPRGCSIYYINTVHSAFFNLPTAPVSSLYPSPPLLANLSPFSSQAKQVHDIWRLPQIYGVQRLLCVQPGSHHHVPRYGSPAQQLLHLLIAQHLPDWRPAHREEPPGRLRVVRQHLSNSSAGLFCPSSFFSPV